MCTGRVDPATVVRALKKGLDGLIVIGCHFGDCHYISGNLVARRKFAVLKNFLGYLGVEPERVQLMAQGLLLREQGYACDHGVLYFAGSRTRVDVPFDDVKEIFEEL